MTSELIYRTPRNEREQLLQVVRTVRHRWRLRMLLRGAAILIFSGLALALTAGLAIDTSRFDATTVAVARILAYLALAVILVRTVAWPLLRRVSDERIALYLEENEPDLEGRVLNAVELGHEPAGGPAPATSPRFIERIIASAVDECRKADGGRRVERRKLRRSSGLLVGSTAFSFAVFLLGPTFLGVTTPVLLDPWKKPEAVNPYRIRVEPGDTRLAKGSDLKVSAELENFEAAQVELVVRGGDGQWTRWSMLREDDAVEAAFSLLIFDLGERTEYFVEAGGVRSDVFEVEVVELPYVDEIHLTYRFPAYTGLDPVEQPGSGDVAALVGTEVDLDVRSTLPVPGGAIEIDGGETISLVLGGDGRLRGSLVVREPGSYRILLDNVTAEGEDGGVVERVVASPDYLIDPFTDQPPILTVGKPGRDVKVTSLEEVTTEVRAQDDYGVRRLDLVYSVNGGDEQTAVLYDRRPGRKDFVGTHTLYLEEYELVPGDLVSYYARALDGYEPLDDGDRLHETFSDIYFIEIRPFDLNYRQADQAGQPGAGMNGGDELSSQQRMIVAATFKLSRRPSDSEGYGDDISTIAMSQGRLREQVDAMMERLAGQGILGGDSPAAGMAELLPKAAEAMTEAEEALGEHRPKVALGPEQRALQYLQRVEAAIRDIQVSRGQQGGGGGQGRINDELADLFDMELDKLRNQYEQVQRSRQQSVDDAVDEVLERLRELARRQQQENERMRARARQSEQGSRAGSSGRSQRQLAEEAEEVARQLERLAREESLPELAETARRLREAAEQMRRAAAAGERSAEALGSAALDQLRDARRQLDRNKSGRLERDTRRALDETRRLREQQERMIDRVERLDSGDASYGRDLEELMAAKERMGAEVGRLEADLDQLSRDARREQPEASRRLQEAVSGIRDDKIKEKILYSRGVVQQRSKAYARNFEEHIGDTLGELEERLRAARGAIGETREQRLERALEETREAVTALESLEDRMRESGGRGGRADSGDPLGGDPNADPAGDPDAFREGSGRLRPQDLRQFGRELGERRLQLEQLRDRLGREGIDASDLERIIDLVRGIAAQDALEGPDVLGVLESEVVQGLKEFEFGLRRNLGLGDDERLLQMSDGEVPEGYEEMVERYYKALAGGED